jgi:hypothetical protein
MPAVLWLIGRFASSSTLHAFGVSPSMTPGSPWEVVWQCEAVFTAHTSRSNPTLAPLSQLMLWCLRLLLPDQRLPLRYGGADGEPMEWLGVADCGSVERQKALSALESRDFVKASDSVLSGDEVYYSREVLPRQRGQLSAEEMMRGVVQEVMRDTILFLR